MAASTKVPPNPQGLLGNPARTAPGSGKSSAVPLNLDAAIAGGLPDQIPFPYPPSPHLTDQAKILVNQQAIDDYNGIVKPYKDFLASNKGAKPDKDKLQSYATHSNVIFEFEGTIYKPGKYVPG